MFFQFFATKPISEYQQNTTTHGALNRSLSAGALTALGVGATIGTGIFVLTGTAAANHAGPALMLSFVIAGIGCALAALCYAEFASMIPVAGSAYSYTYATLGEGVAWFIGWNLILEYLFAVGTVAVGWSGYVTSALAQIGVHVPDALAHAPIDRGSGRFGIVATGAFLNLPAALIVGLIGSVCYVGIRESARVNTIVVAIKVTVIVLFVLVGISYFTPENWRPFVPANTGTFGQFGWSGVFAASGIIFFAYIGFDAVSTCAQEARNPQRDMPRGILLSLLICTILYIATTAVLTGMVSYRELDVAAPVAFALDKYPKLQWLALPLKMGIIAGMTSVMLVLTLAQARIFLAMARDGLLPACFARVHPKFQTPSTGTIVTTVAAALVGGILPVRLLGELVSIGTLMAFVTVCIGVLVLRVRKPELVRPFRAPLPWLTSLGGAVVCGGMMLALPLDTWLRLAAWTTIGFVVYAIYGARYSKLRSGRQVEIDPRTGCSAKG